MQDTPNMLTHWSIQLQSFDFTVYHMPKKLNLVPDALLRLFSAELDREPIPLESGLAAICRNAPNDQPYFPPAPREYEVSAHTLDNVVPVESDCDLFSRAISVFPVADTAQIAPGSRMNLAHTLSTWETHNHHLSHRRNLSIP